MKKLKVILVLFAAAFLFQSNLNVVQKKGLVQFQLNLSDGEKIDLNKFMGSADVQGKLGDLRALYLNQETFGSFQKSAIIRSMAPKGTDPSNLVEFVKYYLPDYFYPSPTILSDFLYSDYIRFDGVYHWDKLYNIRSYYESVFQNQTARKIAFDAAVKFVVAQVENYPNDFKKSILLNIDSLILFTNYLRNNPNLLNDDYSAIQSELDRSYFKGFIFRRIRDSKVPVSEVLSFLNIAKTQIQTAVPKDGFALVDISINSQVKVFLGAEWKCFLYSPVNQKSVALIGFPRYISMYSENGKSFYLLEFDNGTKNLFSQDLHKEY